METKARRTRNQGFDLVDADFALQMLLAIAVRFDRLARDIREEMLCDSEHLSRSYQVSKVVERLAEEIRRGADDIVQGVVRHLDERYAALKSKAGVL